MLFRSHVAHDDTVGWPCRIDGFGQAEAGLIRGVLAKTGTHSFVESCHVEPLIAWRALDDNVRLVDSTRLDRLKEGAERRLATLASLGIDGINLFHSEWSGGLATLAHRFNRTAFGWGIEYDRHFQTAFRMGLDAVYSDYVDRMMDSYRHELGRPTL